MAVLGVGLLFHLLLSMMTKKGDFTFCHPHIASILSCPCPENQSPNQFLKETTTTTTCSLQFPVTSSTDDLIRLAHECDDYVFCNSSSSNNSSSNQLLLLGETNGILQALADLGQEEDAAGTVVAATLLALNGLESAIRHSTLHVPGRAPLLKTMISKMETPHLARACELLLLPQGVNLRNLLWHGFIEYLPRPWLALVLVLTKLLLHQDLDTATTSTRTTNDDDPVVEVMELRSFPEFQKILLDTTTTTTNDDDILDHPPSQVISKWLPDSHGVLWNLAVHWIQERRRPASICAILSILLEHGLRLDWCRLNDQPKDLIPRPGAYYVTLDGHGQRHIHDLLLSPYLMDGRTKNKLLYELDGSTIALLTDLFCSSCGGPNIRSTVAHGLWDSFLICEWTTTTMPDENECLRRLWDMVRVILVAMEWTASSQEEQSMILPYRPVFSYTAVTRRNLRQAQESLQELQVIQQSESYQNYWNMARGEFGDLSEELYKLDIERTSILETSSSLLSTTSSEALLVWTAQDVFEEHDLNVRLANAGATRTLLKDVSAATNAHIQCLKEALEKLAEDNNNKRKRRTLLRIVHSSQLAKIIYRFATYVAIVSLQQQQQQQQHDDESSIMDPALMLKAVERSRMVVSTVNNFLHTKIDRAHKSAKEYTKGKGIKEVLQVLLQDTLES